MTTNALKTFSFAPGLDLRSIDIDGSPWFVAADVCKALGIGNCTVALYAVRDAHKAKKSIGSTGSMPWSVSEGGLYSLILKSRKPQAIAFQDWITDDVLPSIRKTGGYMTPEVAVLAVEDPAVFMARALVIANET